MNMKGDTVMMETNSEKPRVILLNGSPHKEGTTNRALVEVAQTLEKAERAC